MPTDSLTYWGYLADAFHRKVHIPLLGKMPANKMALGVAAVAGMANPGFWLLGIAAELIYLFGVGGSERYQKLVRGERLLAEQQQWAERVSGAVQRLHPENRDRYRRLLEVCRRILGISEALDEDSLGNFRDLRAQSLNQLLGIFLRLLTSREIIADNVRNLDRTGLEQEISRLTARLDAEPGEGRLRRSLQATLEIQSKRLENLSRAEQSLQVMNAELMRIEQQVELIREESAVSGKPEQLSVRLDAVTSAMSETSRWMDEHAAFLGSLGAESDNPLPELPELPVVAEGE